MRLSRLFRRRPKLKVPKRPERLTDLTGYQELQRIYFDEDTALRLIRAAGVEEREGYEYRFYLQSNGHVHFAASNAKQDAMMQDCERGPYDVELIRSAIKKGYDHGLKMPLWRVVPL